MPLSEIVNVTITKATAAVTRAGFGTPLFVSEFTAPVGWSGTRVAAYNDIDEVAVDFPLGTEAAYLQAAAAFNVEPAPSQIKIGREDSGDASKGDTMDAIVAEDNDWYGFTHETRAEADIVALAAWAEPRENKLFVAQSSNADVKSDTTPNELDTLNTAARARTAYLWHALDAEFADSAFLANGLAKSDLDAIDGQINWSYLTLKGITPDTLTTTERANIEGKNGNIYITVGGLDVTRFGTTCEDGTYIDITTTIDWTQSRMTEDVWQYLATATTKVPYTQAGIDGVESVVRGRLAIGVENGHFAPGFTVSVPAIGDVPSNDKASRTLNNVTWAATLAGAINKVNIRGTVSV